MNILGKIWNGFCWLWVGLFLLGVPSGILMYFTEPDVTFFESIGVAIFCIPLAWMFYAIGPKNSRDKRIEEMKAIAERAAKKKAADDKKAKAIEKEAKYIDELLEMVNEGLNYSRVEKKMRVFKHHKNSDDLKKIKDYILKGHEEKEAKEKKDEDTLIQEIKKMISNNQDYKLVQEKMMPFKHVKESEIKNIESYITEGQAKEEEDRIRALCHDEDQFKSYKKGKVCLGMHIEVVKEIKGYKYDEKRNISADKETYKYKYGMFTTSRGNKRYKLEVTYENDRVVSFKDL
tara:strand:- start:491 stop:1357 length:867 start_codon:yes stop_codon:yes gene_type:complete